MATKTANQSKSAFVRGFIRKNPTANRKAVEQAWHEAGHEGPIQSSCTIPGIAEPEIALYRGPLSRPETERAERRRDRIR